LFVYGTLQRELDTDMSRFLVANSKTVAKGYGYTFTTKI